MSRTSSSISSSDAPRRDPWRRLFARFVLAAAGLLAALYVFVATVDPWDVLPFSPGLPRVPVSSNARFAMPGLARSPQFDSAVIGSSSSRLLRPEELDRVFGGRFVNLAMNAATAWEQSRMLALFARTHPDARTVIVGLDSVWCTETPERLTGRPFPDWMYSGPPIAGYAHILNLYAVQEAANEALILLGLKRRRYGLDGYTRFVPPEEDYDPARVAAAFARWPVVPFIPEQPVDHRIPTLPMLEAGLHGLPQQARKILFFTPSFVTLQGTPGSDYAAMLRGCKAQVTAIARAVPNTVVVDFLRPTALTTDVSHYWDPVHYRLPVASLLIAGMAAATRGEPVTDGAALH